MHIILLGASGLVGSQALQQLLHAPFCTRVTAPVRKPLAVTHPKLMPIVFDFSQPEKHRAQLKADAVFSALGTTIAQAGSQEKFREVDYTYQLHLARIARQEGALRHVLISSLGANVHSSIFYMRVKGEIEQEITALGYEAQYIFRPSILLGKRNDKRLGEATGQWVARNLPFLFSGPLKKYTGIEAATVAAAMLAAVQKPDKGLYIVENTALFAWAKP